MLVPPPGMEGGILRSLLPMLSGMSSRMTEQDTCCSLVSENTCTVVDPCTQIITLTENMSQALCLKDFQTFFFLGNYHAPIQIHFSHS